MIFKKKKDKNIDFSISMTLCASFVVLTFQYAVLIIFNLSNTQTGSAVQMISKFIVALFFIYSFPVMWRRVGKKLLIVYGISILIFSLQFLFYTSNRPYLVELIFPVFFMSLPALVYTLSLRDLKVFQTVLIMAAKAIFLIGVIISIFIFSGNATAGAYSMSLSYYMLLPAILFLREFFNKYNFFSLIQFLITMIIILSFGSRGALLCIAVFTLLMLIRIDKDSLRKAVIFRLGIICAMILLIVQYKQILSLITSQLAKYGISSRTLRLLQEDEIHLSGRDSILNIVIEEIKAHPLEGIGIAGERILIGTYSHNLITELLSSFGVIVGLIIIFCLTILIIRAFIISNKFSYDLLTLWLSIGFVHLMVSGSYIIEIKFWIFLGLLILLNFKFSKRKLADYD